MGQVDSQFGVGSGYNLYRIWYDGLGNLNTLQTPFQFSFIQLISAVGEVYCALGPILRVGFGQKNRTHMQL